MFCKVLPYTRSIFNIFFLFILPKVEKELLSIVLSPLNPLYLPTTLGYPQDPFGKVEENLLDFLCFYSCVLDFFALLSDVISSICHSEGENFLEIFESKNLIYFSQKSIDKSFLIFFVGFYHTTYSILIWLFVLYQRARALGTFRMFLSLALLNPHPAPPTIQDCRPENLLNKM